MPRGISARKRSKPEVQEEFDQIRHEVVETRQSTTEKDLAEARHGEGQIRKLIEGVSIDSVVERIAGLGLEVTKALAEMSAKLVAEVERLTQVREAVALEERELTRLHKIDVSATALDQLVESYERQRQMLESEITNQRSTWAEERQAHFREEKETEETLKKQRQRELEDHEYRRNLERKKAQDKYEEDVRVQTKRNNEQQEALERSWQAREEALKQQEEDLKRFKDEVDSVPARLAEEREKVRAETSQAVQQSFEQQLTLLKKDAEAERRLGDLRTKGLEDIIASQVAQLASLGKQLEEAKRQVQEIAVRAIEGASGANALAHVNQIAIEQAKTRPQS